MKIKTVTTHTVTFSVQSFEETEGGMVRNHYGGICTELGDAIQILRLAKIHSGDDWVIVCDVETTTCGNEI